MTWPRAIPQGDIFSLRGLLTPLHDIDLDLEYAFANSQSQPESQNDTAYHLNLFGHHNWISYRLETVHAGPDYPGYYRDLDFKSGRVTLPLWTTLKLNAYYRHEQQNLDLNPIFQSAPRRTNLQFGLSYKPWRRTTLSLDYWNRTREDRLPDPDFDFTEETLRLTLGHNLNKLNLWASAEAGQRRDNLARQSGQLQKYSFSASWRPTQAQSYRAYLQFSQEDSAAQDWRRITGGLSASFRLGRATRLTAGFQRSEYDGPIFMGRDQADLEFAHEFRNHHELSVRGRYASYSDSYREDELAVMVEYAIPFGLPVSRKTSTGILKGRVFDAENPRQGIPRAIVRLNELTAVTDRNGNFTFGSLKPGTYYLTLDRASIGMDRVTVEKSPLSVTVAAGKKNRIEVGVIPGATVRGRVVLYRFANETAFADPAGGSDASADSRKADLVESHGLANIPVELTGPSETLRRVTDRRGRFVFEDVRPGNWTLKIHQAGLPDRHYLEHDTFTFDLKPGDSKDVLARVLPKKRTIQIIEQGGVIEEKK